ncbi:hypothetical protein HMPREF0208_03192 [Citrobacter koseri]|nr:hypothetical protein HMPREF0208_03192 [Citrobacter koseri]
MLKISRPAGRLFCTCNRCPLSVFRAKKCPLRGEGSGQTKHTQFHDMFQNMCYLFN